MPASNTTSPSGIGPRQIPGRRVRRVLMVDDHPIVRQGLRRVLENEADLVVCGELESAREVPEAVIKLNPDVSISDISLKEGDGIELVKTVRASYPELPILVLPCTLRPFMRSASCRPAPAATS